MPFLKCKMCGGDLEIIEGQPFAVCENCGTRQTYPHIDDDEIRERYNLGNYERRNNNFDTAFAIYSDLAISSRGDEPEAYWNTMLCRFGILYQKDYRTNQEVPTLNRTQMNSVFEDPGYLKAIEYADTNTRAYYEQQAEKIEELRKRFIGVINREEPYDVFICYKETDAFGQRTEDSVAAQSLYDYLTKEGYKVFLSRVTLADVAGVDYEPYIFAALNSAKVMFVFGTREEYVNAPWVRNEWSRYLSAIKGDFTRLLIPVYRDDPSYFPAELKMLQGFNMSTPGWYQDAKTRVDKVVGKKTVRQEAAPRAYTGSSDQLIENAKAQLRLGDRGKARKLYQEVTEKYPSDYRGWWGLLEVSTSDFSDAAALSNAKNDVIKLYRNAWTMAGPEERKTIEQKWDGYLKEFSAYSGRQLIESFDARLDAARQEIARLEQSGREIDQQIGRTYQSREAGAGKPDYGLDESIKKLEGSRSSGKVISVLSTLAGVIYGIVGYMTIAYPTDDSVAPLAVVTFIINAIVGFFVGGFVGGVIGFLLPLVLFMVSESLGVIIYLILAFVLLLMGITGFSGKSTKKKLEELYRKKEEEQQAIQEWYASFDKEADNLRGQMAAIADNAQTISRNIEIWQNWGCVRNDYGSFSPRQREFDELSYQLNRKRSGMSYDLGQFGKSLEKLERDCALPGKSGTMIPLSADENAKRREDSYQQSVNESKAEAGHEVVITSAGENKLNVIKAIKDILGIGLNEAKAIADNAPCSVKKGITRTEAEAIRKVLKDAGAGAEIL